MQLLRLVEAERVFFRGLLISVSLRSELCLSSATPFLLLASSCRHFRRVVCAAEQAPLEPVVISIPARYLLLKCQQLFLLKEPGWVVAPPAPHSTWPSRSMQVSRELPVPPSIALGALWLRYSRSPSTPILPEPFGFGTLWASRPSRHGKVLNLCHQTVTSRTNTVAI